MMVTYNRLELTKRMLSSLCKTVHSPFNLVIIDNASTDGTVEYLQNKIDTEFKTDHLRNLFTIFNKENKGIAIGRNQALKNGVDVFNSDWLVTLDNDVEMPDGWLEECQNILQANRAYGAIGVNMENKPYPIVTKNGFTFQDKPAGNLGTACMVFPKTTQKLLGYFNTEYGPYGEEDADFGMRLRVSGLKLGYIERMGTHFGEGELDKGEYREYKTACHNKNLKKFNENCALYAQGKKKLYMPYSEG
jgi:GT2 family glycosyltransferase